MAGDPQKASRMIFEKRLFNPPRNAIVISSYSSMK